MRVVFTHNWNASLYFAVQLLFFDLVVNFRFFSVSCGPTRLTSTNGRNIPEVCHFMSFTAITEREREREFVKRCQGCFQTRINHHYLTRHLNAQIRLLNLALLCCSALTSDAEFLLSVSSWGRQIQLNYGLPYRPLNPRACQSNHFISQILCIQHGAHTYNHIYA